MVISAFAAVPLFLVAQVVPGAEALSAPFTSEPFPATEQPVLADTRQKTERDPVGVPTSAASPEPSEPTSDAKSQSLPQPVVPQPAATQSVVLADQAQTDIVVTARPGDKPSDPLAGANKVSFGATQAVDKAVIAPVAHAYQHAVPEPVRNGLRNALNNLLDEPIVFLNFLLIRKPGKAAETLARFAINSTIGLAGVFDIAKRRPFNLPRRNIGFADTLACYGVGSGPFLFLPLVGPTTLRDIFGGAVDGLVLPTLVGKPFNQLKFTGPAAVVHELDSRIELDDDLEIVRGAADPYQARRASYLRTQQTQTDALHCRHHRPRRATSELPGQAYPAGSL